MTSISLIQFSDKEGKSLSEVLQVPNTIDAEQLRSLINTTQDLYVNGCRITGCLEDALSVELKNDEERIKKITLSEEVQSAQPAIFCSGVYSGHEGPVLAVKHTGSILVTAGGDKTCRFWDLITKTQFMIVQKHTHWVTCLDANDEYVVSGGMDKLVNLYDLAGNHIRTLARHREGVVKVKLFDDKIISISRDCSCIVWKIDGTVLASWNHSKPIKSFCCGRDETGAQIVCTASGDGVIKVYKNYKYQCDLTGHRLAVNCIEIADRYIISGDDSGAIIIWKNFVLHKRITHKREVISLSFSPNGLSFASGSFDKTVKVWSVETAELLANYYHVNFVYKVMYVNDLVISCSKDKTIRMFKVSKGKVVSDLVCDDEIYDFDFMNGLLVCGSKSNKVYFFN